MENNNIMEKLLQDGKQVSDSVKDDVSKKKTKTDAWMEEVRLVTAKYKVYIVIGLVFICLLLLFWIPNSSDKLKDSKDFYAQTNTKLNSIWRDIETAKQDMDYLCDDTNWIISNESAFIKCLNWQEECSLPETWKTWTGNSIEDYNTKIPLSYLQLHSLYSKKMPVDEKIVLKNLNEYLIKQDISWTDRSRVGDILRIEIWDPEAVAYGVNKDKSKLFQVSVDVEIEFATVDDLVDFLYNVEKKLIEDRADSKWEIIKNSENRILYKIQSVSYDIVTNDEPQITDISMIAYYYYDEKFDGKSECNDSEISSDNDTEKTVDTPDNKNNNSFFQRIIKKIKRQ